MDSQLTNAASLTEDDADLLNAYRLSVSFALWRQLLTNLHAGLLTLSDPPHRFRYSGGAVDYQGGLLRIFTR